MSDIRHTWFHKGRGEVDGKKVFSSDYFVSHNCISCGWAVEDANSFEDYKIKLKKHLEEPSINKKWSNKGPYFLFECLRKGDFIWTRDSNGLYYVAEIPDDPKNLFYNDASFDAQEKDARIQIRDINWTLVGTEEKVPGGISTYSQNIRTLIRVDNNDDEEIDGYTATSYFSAVILNKVRFKKLTNRANLFNFIGPNGLEDLFALWLYDKFSYVTIPSTNKISTPRYEFVLIDGNKSGSGYNSDKRIYIQCKNFKKVINSSDYKDILINEGDEFWLISSRGKIITLSGDIITNKILKITKQKELIEEQYEVDELLGFAFDDKNKTIIPGSILRWINNFQ